MPYRLALDVGTASCALVAVALDERREPVSVLHHSIHIFSEPLLPATDGGVGEPKKAARRRARQQRRIIERRARRLRRIARLASLLDLDHTKISPAPKSKETIHALRAKAATQRIELEDLLRVMLKLAKRRGYAGGFRTRKDSEKGQVESGISALAETMKTAGCSTLGQYLLKRFEAGETLKLKQAGLYASRDMLIAEFNAIWDKQQEHYPLLREERPDALHPQQKPRPIRAQFFDAVFYQRPLRPVAPMVGNCRLEPSLPRAPLAQPAAQAFRIEKQLADLRWGTGQHAQPLSLQQRDAVREMLNDPEVLDGEGKLSFAKIRERLASIPKLPGQRATLNMERSSREYLVGNQTLRAFRGLGVLDQWQSLSPLTQIRIINFLADLGSPDLLDQPDWYLRFTKTQWSVNPQTGKREARQVPKKLDPDLVRFVNALVATGKFGRMSDMGLPAGRAAYCVRALERLTNHMRTHCVDEHAAIEHCYPAKPSTGALLKRLPVHAPTGNVVVDVALRVVHRAVNAALDKLAEPPAEVVVELAREMALGVKARAEIEKKIDRNRHRKLEAAKALRKHRAPATERNVLRYLLWESQAHHCPYCNTRISLEQALDGNQTNRDHILPRSLTRVGRQRDHLVLAHRSCNDLKAGRTPFEAFGHDAERWGAVTHCASILRKNGQSAKARLLELQDHEREVLDESAIAEFSARQFAETSWIAKLAAQWLRSVAPRVYVSRGTLTAYLRRIWKLDTVIAEVRLAERLPVLDTEGKTISRRDFAKYKAFWEGHGDNGVPQTDRRIEKRIDHRQHLIDALVLAQISPGLYQRMARHYKERREKQMAGLPARPSLAVAPPMPDLREKALDLVRSARVIHKPDRLPGGPFFQEYAYRVLAGKEEGRTRLLRRKPLSSLAKQRDTADTVKKRIEEIASAEVRTLVKKAFERRIKQGKTPFEALQEPVPYPRYRTLIRSVRCVHQTSAYVLIAHRSRTGTHQKAMLHQGWACLRVRRKEDGKVQTELVSPWEAAHGKLRDARADGSILFFKGDTVVDEESGKEFVIRQIKAQGGGMLFMTPVADAREVRDMTAKDGLKTASGKALLSLRPV